MSTRNRLTAVAPDLVEFGKILSARQRKEIAFRVAEWACRSTDAMTFLNEDCVQRLLSAGYDPTEQECQIIAEDAGHLDERYFAIVEQHDGLDDAGEAMLWFRKARAAASLVYALDASSVQDFCETLYEAQAATGNLDGLRALCTEVP